MNIYIHSSQRRRRHARPHFHARYADDVAEIPLAAAFLAGHAHATYRQAGGQRLAILPDFLIGAHAVVTRRPLLTRDPRRVATHIPGTTVVSPDRDA